MKKLNLILIAILANHFLFPTNIYAQTVVSQNSSVQVSNIYQGSKPESLVDGNLSLGWNSGAFAPQWAILDLHSPKSISQLRLMSGQSPDGQVLFKITLSSEDHSTVFELTLDRYVKAGQWINIPMLSSIANVRYIKLETIKSPSWIAWQELEATDTPSAGSQHLRYFGYYGLVSGGVPLVYHFTEISNLANSNVGIIPSHTAQKMREMLTLAKSAGLKVFIAPRNITYNDSTLNPNYQQILTGLHSLFEEFDSVILGFYFDEMIGSGTDIADFTKITSYLRSKYPSKKILAIESDTPISVMSIPPSYFTNLTDVGFDYYSSVWTASNEVGWAHYLDTWEKLKKLAPNLNYWIIPDGLATTKEQSLRWPELWEKYLGLAMSEDRVVGIMNFIWPSLLPFENYGITYKDVFDPNSSNYNSSLKDFHIRIGKSIINRQSGLKGDLNNDNKVDTSDFTILRTDFGTKYTIFDYNNLVTNYGK